MRPLLLLLSALVSIANSYNILIYNVRFGHSHSNFMGSMADILVDAGHNVTTLVPIVNEQVKSDGTLKSRIINIEPTDELREDIRFLYDDTVDMFEVNPNNPVLNLFIGYLMGEAFKKSCRTVLEMPGLMEELKNAHFDVIIAENFEYCGVGIAHVIKPKAVITGSSTVCYFPEMGGIPKMLSFSPSTSTTHLDVHSIVSRAWNVINEYSGGFFFTGIKWKIHNLFAEKYGSDFPSWEEIISSSAYTFENTEPLIDFALPTLHRVINIPAIGAREPKSLDKDWLNILTKRKRSVLISFGSVAESYKMKNETKRSILKTISAFPDVTFIWKYEKDDEFALKEASKVVNLVLSKWTPQNDLLNHENLVAFISHGGMGSVQETARRGVPAVYIPIFADQQRNAAMMEHNGLGKVFDKFELRDADKLAAALREILEDNRYAQRAKHVSRMLNRKPFTSKEILTKHVEFAAEFGPSRSLRPQSYDMNFIEYHNLDILVIFGVISSVVILVVVKGMLSILRMFTVTKIKSD